MIQPEFVAWPKTPRLRKSIMVITEKIDGTNAAVGFVPDDDGKPVIYAQSRNRLIDPLNDNYGFAEWAYENQRDLFDILGYGLHFGEWWGSGIQRGYGLPKGEKRFSLFNTQRFGECLNDRGWRDANGVPEALHVVPVLAIHALDTVVATSTLVNLALTGSQAAPGWPNPEGVCVFIPAIGKVFKVTFDGDDHKGA